MKVVLRTGLGDLRHLIGNSAFSKVPLSSRLVSSSFVHVDDLDLTNSQFHPAMVGSFDPQWLADYRKGLDTPETKALRYVLRSTKGAAKRIVQHHWQERNSIRFLEEYMVPEFDPHTSIFCPVEPPIGVVESLEELRSSMAERRRIVRATNPDASFPAGFWLRDSMRTADLLGMLTVEETGFDTIDSVVEQYLGSSTVEWVLWQTNDPEQPLLYAVPRVTVDWDASNRSARPRRCFRNTRGRRLRSTSRLSTPAMQDDPELYDFASVFRSQERPAAPEASCASPLAALAEPPVSNIEHGDAGPEDDEAVP